MGVFVKDVVKVWVGVEDDVDVCDGEHVFVSDFEGVWLMVAETLIETDGVTDIVGVVVGDMV